MDTVFLNPSVKSRSLDRSEIRSRISQFNLYREGRLRVWNQVLEKFKLLVNTSRRNNFSSNSYQRFSSTIPTNSQLNEINDYKDKMKSFMINYLHA